MFLIPYALLVATMFITFGIASNVPELWFHGLQQTIAVTNGFNALMILPLMMIAQSNPGSLPLINGIIDSIILFNLIAAAIIFATGCIYAMDERKPRYLRIHVVLLIFALGLALLKLITVFGAPSYTLVWYFGLSFISLLLSQAVYVLLKLYKLDPRLSILKN